MNIASTSGADLDYWVAIARGLEPSIQVIAGERICFAKPLPTGTMAQFRPSSRWRDGGPVMQGQKFELKWSETGHWHCSAGGQDRPAVQATGESLLVAAMRAYVMAYFGELALVGIAP